MGRAAAAAHRTCKDETEPLAAVKGGQGPNPNWMNPTNFPETNATIGPPRGMSEAQCRQLRAFAAEMVAGPMDGAPVYVVAWQPTLPELERLIEGNPVFITMLGGVMPHYVSTSFEEATHSAKAKRNG